MYLVRFLDLQECTILVYGVPLYLLSDNLEFPHAVLLVSI